jgi:hypothetical protein
MKANHTLGLLIAFLAVVVVAGLAPWAGPSEGVEAEAGSQSNPVAIQPSRIAETAREESADLVTNRQLQLHVTVSNENDVMVEGAKLGLAFASIAESGFAERELQTDSSGSATFVFEEGDLRNRGNSVCTVSLLTPSNPPQVQEVHMDRWVHARSFYAARDRARQGAGRAI